MAASVDSYYYPIPNSLLHLNLQTRRNPKSFVCFCKARSICSSSSSSSHSSSPSACLNTTHHLREKQGRQQQLPLDNSFLFRQLGTHIETTGFAAEEDEEPGELGFRIAEAESDIRETISSKMWWADLKAAVGQRINVEGLVSSATVLLRDRHLALPHLMVPDARYIDWGELKRRGFEGVVFDKDNTLTAPYSLSLWPPLGPSIEQCKAVFGNDVAVFSNSAGLAEYDHDDLKARALERSIGIKVLRHSVKKPGGSAEEIEGHFGCTSSHLIMVGDRPFTDIVYGNRNGFLTILTEPMSLVEEPFIVKKVRKLEMFLLKRWFRSGLRPVSHILIPDAKQCARDSPIL